MLPVFSRWLAAEHARGTPMEQILAVLPALATSLVFMGVRNFYSDGTVAATMAEELKRQMERVWKRSRKEILKG